MTGPGRRSLANGFGQPSSWEVPPRCASCARATAKAATSMCSPTPTTITPATFSSTWMVRNRRRSLPCLQRLLADLALQLCDPAFRPALLAIARKDVARALAELPAPAMQHVGVDLQRARRFPDGYPLFQPPHGGQFKLLGELPS